MDLIFIRLFARSLGRTAADKGHPGNAGMSALIMIAAETVGVGLGYVAGGLLVGGLLGLVSLALGATVAYSRVSSLPNLHDQGMKQEAVIGPSLGEQVIGQSCPQCDKPFLTMLEVARCPRCQGAYHQGCVSTHRARAHKKARRKKPATASENA
jgi:hypothetical protein